MTGPDSSAAPRSAPAALVFDLLTCLLNSWEIWEQAAASPATGQAWRTAATERMISHPKYVDYRILVEEASREVGLPAEASTRLFRRWPRLRPWPDVPPFMARVTIPFAVVTNCSGSLAVDAATRLPRRPVAVISAEMAGAYKPDPRPYAAALAVLQLRVEDVLYVAGSAYDARGAHAFGLPTRWIDRGSAPEVVPVIRYPSLLRLEAELYHGPLTPS